MLILGSSGWEWRQTWRPMDQRQVSFALAGKEQTDHARLSRW